uniref:Clr5 domain-containing protein n=1 Tax=Bionectria ochroleuca TaxID=29856 RepID=A0A8H7K8Q2_BIOOC
MVDIFTQHRPLIKRLYQEERKSLKQVKEILESEYQFPESSLAFYEIKLRDLLGVRKKFKKEDWPVIYQHHLNSNRKKPGKKSDALVQGKRPLSCAAHRPLHLGLQVPAPKRYLSIHLANFPRQAFSDGLDRMFINSIIESNWITCDFDPHNLANDAATSSNNHNAANIDLLEVDTSMTAVVSFSRLDCNPLLSYEDEIVPVSQNIQPPSGYTEVTASSASIGPVSRVQILLEYLPWQSCRLLFSTFLKGESSTQIAHQTANGIIYSLIPRDCFSTDTSGLGVVRMCDTTFPVPWDIRQTSSRLNPSSNIEVYCFLAQAIYLLSNSLLYWEDLNTIELFQVLLQLPPGTIFSIFQNDLPSIYAAWEGLLRLVIQIVWPLDGEIPQIWRAIDFHSVTCSLIEVALHRTKWLTENDEYLVLAAISIPNPNLLKQMLDKGACPEKTQKRREAIFSAALAGSAPCIKILIEGCDPNHKLEDSRSEFTYILERTAKMSLRKHISEQENKQRELLLQVVDSYLEAGADVDSPYPPCDKHRELLEQIEAPKDWYPTYLDWTLQRDRELFDRAQPRSSVGETTITRHGILLAAMQGKSALLGYIKSRGSQTATGVSRFLKLVIREQFMLSFRWNFFDIKIVKSFLGIGLQIPHSDYSTCCERLLERSQGREDHDSLWVLNHLFQNGLVVTWSIFRAAVFKEGTDMLDVLRKYAVDVGKIGGPALVKAARLGNYEAVDWLLGFGVDIKSLIPDKIGNWVGLEVNTLIGILICTSWENPDTSMLRYLVGCGAELKRTVSDQHAGGLTELIRRLGVGRRQGRLVPWLLDQLEVRGTGKMLRAELQALYALAPANVSIGSENRTLSPVLNRLRNTYGLPPCPEAILGPMIAAGACNEIIQEFVRASIDINTYSEETHYERLTPIQAAASVGNYPLVVQLFEIGADVNSPPRGKNGRTALQAICAWNPLSEKDKSRQQDIVNFLIKKGAKVNAAPAHGCNGRTAVMASAVYGNIELATVLLAHGADPNIYPWQLTPVPYAALDLAYGSCDMTKLLLNAGAVSSHRGSTGYEGALWWAKQWGYNAVADIISDHMLQKEEQFRSNSELRAFHNAVVHKLDLEDASRHANAIYDEKRESEMEEIQILSVERGWNYPPQPPHNNWVSKLPFGVFSDLNLEKQLGKN